MERRSHLAAAAGSSQPMAQEKFLLGAVILAAGRSSRMGQSKLLLPWGETSVLGHLRDQWRQIGAAQVAVVHAAGDRLILAELDRLAVAEESRIANTDPERGMFRSILCAAEFSGWRPELTHWAIVLGDQPQIQRATLVDLLEFARGHPARVCQPIYHGAPRHPVVLPKSVFLQLAKSQAINLREFIASFEVAGCPCGDSGVELDIDSPEDYLRALASAGLLPRHP
jgi:molybdenum cofactor cytidylyltransferase